MADDEFGTAAERHAALKVAEACTALNLAIWDAKAVGVNVRVIDLTDDWDEPSNLQIHRMERRVMILPAQKIEVFRGVSGPGDSRERE